MTKSDFGADIFGPDESPERKDHDTKDAESADQEPRRKPARKSRRKKATPAAEAEGPAAAPPPGTTDESAPPAAAGRHEEATAPTAAGDDLGDGGTGLEVVADESLPDEVETRELGPERNRGRRRRRSGRRRTGPEAPDEPSAPIPPAERDWVLDEDDDARHAHAPEEEPASRERAMPDDEVDIPSRPDREPIEEREDTYEGRRGGQRQRQRHRGRRGEREGAVRRPGLPAPSPDTEVHGQRIAVFLNLARLRREAATRDAELAFGRLLRHLSQRRHLIRAVAYVTPDEAASVTSTLRGSGFDVRTVESEVLPVAIAVDAMAIAPRVDSVVVLPGERLLGPLAHSLDGAGVRLETGSFVQTPSELSAAADVHHDLGEECLFRP